MDGMVRMYYEEISPCQICIVRSMCDDICEDLWDYIEPCFISYRLTTDHWRHIVYLVKSTLRSSKEVEEWFADDHPESYSLWVTFDHGNITRVLSMSYAERDLMKELTNE